MRDYGITIALDERLGDILEDKDGNLKLLENVAVLEQSINTLLQTQLGEEDLFPGYGIDWLNVFKNIYTVDTPTLVKYMVRQGLVTDNEPMIGDNVTVNAEWEDETNGRMRVDTFLIDVNGNMITSRRVFNI